MKLTLHQTFGLIFKFIFVTCLLLIKKTSFLSV